MVAVSGASADWAVGWSDASAAMSDPADVGSSAGAAGCGSSVK
jgi:hypothetical protein